MAQLSTKLGLKRVQPRKADEKNFSVWITDVFSDIGLYRSLLEAAVRLYNG